MKTVNIYVRVANLRNDDMTVSKYIGGLLLEYEGKRKSIFYDRIDEEDQHMSMWNLVLDGVSKIKEPCNIRVNTLNKMGHVVGNEVMGKIRSKGIRDELSSIVELKGHSLDFQVCKDKDDPKHIIFKEIKKELEKYRREYYKEHR